METKIPNDELVNAGLHLMRQSGRSLARMATKGRAMLYRMENGETVRVRTCNDHILIAVADSPKPGANLNIEGTDWLLIVMPKVSRTQGEIIAYLIPTQVVVEEVRGTHRAWLASNPKTKGANTTWNLWFDDIETKKASGYAKKWASYLIKNDGGISVGEIQNEKKDAVSSIKAEVDASRVRIAKIAGVSPEAVRISIDFDD